MDRPAVNAASVAGLSALVGRPVTSSPRCKVYGNFGGVTRDHSRVAGAKNLRCLLDSTDAIPYTKDTENTSDEGVRSAEPSYRTDPFTSMTEGGESDGDLRQRG